MGKRFNPPVGRIDEITVTTDLQRSAVAVSSVVVSASGAAGQAQLFDNYGANSDRKLNIHVPDGETVQLSFPLPLDFNRGLRVVVNAATTTVSVETVVIDKDNPD